LWSKIAEERNWEIKEYMEEQYEIMIVLDLSDLGYREAAGS
jgi:hypothetical protein